MKSLLRGRLVEGRAAIKVSFFDASSIPMDGSSKTTTTTTIDAIFPVRVRPCSRKLCIGFPRWRRAASTRIGILLGVHPRFIHRCRRRCEPLTRCRFVFPSVSAGSRCACFVEFRHPQDDVPARVAGEEACRARQEDQSQHVGVEIRYPALERQILVTRSATDARDCFTKKKQ